ncbi:DUF3703 domain-containing protein [Acidovorax sp. LjRoot194]|uniref:DUF3703 domain-containing protein n=1 Tax=Acidovorax sp. LjRoot194 TaxID=3342280 RepID=UPI003F4FFB2B
MRVHLATRLDAPPDWVARQLHTTAAFRHVTAPLMRFQPANGEPWPTHWTAGTLELHMWLLGVVPMGSQTVCISIEPAQQAGQWPTLRDSGHGQLLRRWDHRITLEALPDGATLYTDDVDVVARHVPWLMTPLSTALARLFFLHRQRRWRALAAAFRTRERTADAAPASPAHRRRAVDDLLNTFDTITDAAPASRWRWLEAAHVLGQSSLGLHWRTHCAMLRYALLLGDRREAMGQLLRLALVPIGHLFARLPAGNIGRTHVSALKPMAPPAEVEGLIKQALGNSVRSTDASGCEGARGGTVRSAKPRA